MYEVLFRQYVADYFMHGRPIPYADTDSGGLARKSGYRSMRKIG
jgi:hypothetical protein